MIKLIATMKGSIFFSIIKYPSPQPNNEIRNPSIELKVTLISVTICSLIFFICNATMFADERSCMPQYHSCGVKKQISEETCRCQYNNFACYIGFTLLFYSFLLCVSCAHAPILQGGRLPSPHDRK